MGRGQINKKILMIAPRRRARLLEREQRLEMTLNKIKNRPWQASAELNDQGKNFTMQDYNLVLSLGGKDKLPRVYELLGIGLETEVPFKQLEEEIDSWGMHTWDAPENKRLFKEITRLKAEKQESLTVKITDYNQKAEGIINASGQEIADDLFPYNVEIKEMKETAICGVSRIFFGLRPLAPSSLSKK